MRRISVGLAVLLAVGTNASARDLNKQNYLIGERAAGMGGAFVSLTGDATSAYYNPAGLGGLHKKGLSLSASAYQLSVENYPRALDIDMGGGTSIRGQMSSSTFATFPSSIAYVLPFGSREKGATNHVFSFSVLVPDYDKLAARIEAPVGDYAVALNGSYLNTDMTYWIGPSYAVQFGSGVRLGVSVFALAYMTETQAKFGAKMTDLSGTNSYSTQAFDVSGTSVSMLGQAGIQWDVSDSWTVGVTARSPTFGRLYSSVKMLQLSSLYAENGGVPQAGGYADRIEVTKGVTLERRLPLVVAAGANYHAPGKFTVAVDATAHLAQPKYRQFNGPLAYPTDPSGNLILDQSRAIDPVIEAKTNQVVNANLGVEVNLTPKTVARFGVFTDLSAVDKVFAPDPVTPVLDRYGASVGLGLEGEKSTTSFGIVYSGGSGSAPGLNDLLGEPVNKVKVTAHTITAVLAGSADF